MIDDTSAYHEAGHVLVAHLLGGRVLESTIEAEDEGHMGRTTVEWRGFAVRERTRRSALAALAGPIGEAMWRGEDGPFDGPSAWADDAGEIEAALGELAPAAERQITLHEWTREVVQLLQDAAVWESLCRVADALAAHGTLDRDLLDDLGL